MLAEIVIRIQEENLFASTLYLLGIVNGAMFALIWKKGK